MEEQTTVTAVPVDPGDVYAAGDTITTVTTLADSAETTEYLAVDVRGVGMGGASLVRMKAISWTDYAKLNDELREAAVASTDVVIEPPGEWRLALKAALGAVADPEDISAPGALHHDYRDVLWELDEYHPVEDGARYPKNIDDAVFDDLDDAVEYRPVDTGQVYLHNGNAVVYAGKQFGGQESVTELRVNGVQTRTVDVEDIQMVPEREIVGLSAEEIRALEQRDDVWVEHSASHINDMADTVRLVHDACLRPESLTVSLALRREWFDFHRGVGADADSTKDVAKSFIESRLADGADKTLDKVSEFARKWGL